ncbi:MAG: CinA family protein [Rariglobus sp.]|nr:CinA family protein [Rariglobus sp.]
MSVSAAHEIQKLCLRGPVLTLAAAESLTGGRIQSAVTAVSGASGYFLGGVTAYTLDQKVKLLGVNRAAARKTNCVSAEIAEQMARGAVLLFGADLAVSTTGYAEPSPVNHVDNPFAYWALAHRVTARRWHTAAGRIVCPGMTRTQTQEAVASAVLAELAAYLRTLK